MLIFEGNPYPPGPRLKTLLILVVVLVQGPNVFPLIVYPSTFKGVSERTKLEITTFLTSAWFPKISKETELSPAIEPTAI